MSFCGADFSCESCHLEWQVHLYNFCHVINQIYLYNFCSFCSFCSCSFLLPRASTTRGATVSHYSTRSSFVAYRRSPRHHGTPATPPVSWSHLPQAQQKILINRASQGGVPNSIASATAHVATTMRETNKKFAVQVATRRTPKRLMGTTNVNMESFRWTQAMNWTSTSLNKIERLWTFYKQFFVCIIVSNFIISW